MKRFLIVLLILLTTPLTYAKGHYFIFDHYHKELNYLWFDHNSLITEKIPIPSEPKVVCHGISPQQLLAIVNRGQDELIVIDVKNKMIINCFGLGYSAMLLTVAQDRENYFFLAKATTDNNDFDLVHVNIITSVIERIRNFVRQPSEILDVISPKTGCERLYMLIQKETGDLVKLVSINISPFHEITALNIGYNVKKVFPIGQQLILPDIRFTIGNDSIKKVGYLVIIDTESGKQLEKVNISYYNCILRWYPEDQILIVIYNEQKKKNIMLIFKHGSRKVIDIPEIGDLILNNEREHIYMLGSRDFFSINLNDNKIIKVKTGNNGDFAMLAPIQRTNLAVIVTTINELKVIDLQTSKVISVLRYGQKSFIDSISKCMLFLIDPTTLSNPTVRNDAIKTNISRRFMLTQTDDSKYLIANLITNDITILNQEFKSLGFIGFQEPLEFIYQTDLPFFQTFAITKNKVYKVEADIKSLRSIYLFDDQINEAYCYYTSEALIIRTDKEIVVFSLRDCSMLKLYKLNESRFSYVPMYENEE